MINEWCRSEPIFKTKINRKIHRRRLLGEDSRGACSQLLETPIHQ